MTVWEIAKRANVSIATVSRVINGLGTWTCHSRGGYAELSPSWDITRIVMHGHWFLDVVAHWGLVLDLVNPFLLRSCRHLPN